jgi:murein L,D-transpeptidase YafK
VSRYLFVFIAITSAVALAGCYSETIAPVTARPCSHSPTCIIADLDRRNMAKGSPILVRIFKEESELEVWKIDHTGRFALLRTYPICRWLSLRPRRLAGVSFGRLQTKNARRTRWLAGHLTL